MLLREMSKGKKRNKIFYGWWIVGALFIMAVFRVGIIGHGFTTIFEPLVDEFGWSYAQVSFAASLRGIEAGLLAPVMGILVDRFGPRRLIFTGGLIIAAGMFFLSNTSSMLTFYAAFAVIAIGGSASAGTVQGTAVANWFHTKLGLATGIMACGAGFGGFLVPLIANLVDTLDWRTAMVIFSLIALVLILPLSLIVRHRPEDYGYSPDGRIDEPKNLDIGKVPETAREDFTMKQALRSRSFWHIALSYLTHHMIHNAVSTHVMPYLSTVGMSRSISSLVAMGLPVTSMIGRLGFGLFSVGLYRNKKWLIALCFTLEGLSMLLFANVMSEGVLLIVIFVLLNGIGWGGLVPLRAVMLREYFGRHNFGAILGCMMGIEMLGNLLGAPLAGLVYDTMGSYQTIWLIYAGLALFGVIVILNTPRSGSVANAKI